MTRKLQIYFLLIKEFIILVLFYGCNKYQKVGIYKSLNWWRSKRKVESTCRATSILLILINNNNNNSSVYPNTKRAAVPIKQETKTSILIWKGQNTESERCWKIPWYHSCGVSPHVTVWPPPHPCPLKRNHKMRQKSPLKVAFNHIKEQPPFFLCSFTTNCFFLLYYLYGES